MGLNQNTWKINQWYDQYVAGNVEYNGTPAERTKLYIWGANAYGQLGLNNEGSWSPDGQYLTAQSSPIQIPGDWSHVAFGPQYTFAVNTDNELYAWGQNNNRGQLGVNDLTSRSSPTQIPGTTWSKVTTVYDTNLAVKTDGTLWAWGHNESGRLGQNQAVAQLDQVSSPVQIPGTTWSTDKKHISGTYGSFGAIKTNGTLWVWGDHGYGSLGQNSVYTRYSSPVQIPGTTWSMIGGGRNTNFGIKTDGTLWSWGYNGPGHLGQNNRTSRSSPVQVGSDTTWAVVNGGGNCAFAIKTDGTLWSWGSGAYGSLGHGSFTPTLRYSSPVQIPGTTWSWVQAANTNVYASKTDGTIWTWGDNQAGQNAQNDRGGYDGLWGPLLARSSPTQIPGQWNLDALNMSPVPARTGAALKS